MRRAREGAYPVSKGHGPVWRFVTGDLVVNRSGDRTYVFRRNRDVASKWRQHSMIRRAATRYATIAALCGILLAYHRAPALTIRVATITAVGAVLAAAAALIYGTVTYQYRRHHKAPLYSKIASVYKGLKLPEQPERDRWKLARDGSTARLRFDRGVAVAPIYRRRILGIIEDHYHRDYSASWHIEGIAKPYVQFTRRPYPEHRNYADLAEQMAALPAHQIMLGISGNGQPAVWDMDNDAPHMMASIGTGGGKSTLIRTIALQLLAKPDFGGIYLPDVKWTSAKSLEGIEGIHVAKEIPDVMAAVEHVAQIVERRMRGVDDSTNRVVLILEEGNLFTQWVTRWWQSNKPQQAPKQCPTFDHLATVLFAGREFNVNVVAVYQSGMVASVAPGTGPAGGNALRAQFGITVVGRNTPQAWASIVGGSDGPKQLRLPKGPDGETVPGTLILYRQTNQEQDIIGVPMASHEYTQAEALAIAGGATTPLIPVDPPRRALSAFSTDKGDGMTGMTDDALRQHKHRHPNVWAGLGRPGPGRSNSTLYTALEVQDALRATGRDIGGAA